MVWNFCNMQCFNIFSKGPWHSVRLQQFHNKQKRYFAERKTKTSGLWILDTGPILEGICIGISDEIRSEAVNLYLLLNKRGKWSKMFWKTFRLLSNDDNISDCSHRTKRKIFWIMVGVNYWSNYADYADWATWFLWSLRDSWFSHMFLIIWLRPFLLCSVPSYMPSFGEKD